MCEKENETNNFVVNTKRDSEREFHQMMESVPDDSKREDSDKE
ncbi:hypothetical protein ACVSTN_19285 [Yersinia enterocolitica]